MNYSIDYSHARNLRPLAESEREHAAIARLVEFRGDADDVRTAAEIYRRAGEGANAAELERMLPEAGREALAAYEREGK